MAALISSIGDRPALFGAGDHLLRSEASLRSISGASPSSCLGVLNFVFCHVPILLVRRLVGAGQRRQPFLDLLPRQRAAAAVRRTPGPRRPLNARSPRPVPRRSRRSADKASIATPRSRTAIVRLGVAAGEGKADSAGAARRFEVGGRSGSFQYGGEAGRDQAWHRRKRQSTRWSRKRALRASAIGSAASCSPCSAQRLGED